VAAELPGSALVADSTAQLALVDRVEPDRDHHRPARRRRLHKGPRTGVQPRSLDRRSPRELRCSLPVQQRRVPWPSSEPRREVPGRLPPDRVVESPSILRRIGEVVYLDHTSTTTEAALAERTHFSTSRNHGLDGAAAAAGRFMDARRLVSGVAGTRMRPRVGRSRSKVTRSSEPISAAASRTGTTPRPRIAR